MFSRILIKLVDQAIVPAILLLVTRVVSVIGFAKYFNMPFSIDSTGFIFSNAGDFTHVNSYSIFAMLVILSVCVLYILAKSYILHDSHIEPSLTAHLFSLRLSSLIQTSFDIYSQAAVWLSYMFLLLFTSAFMAYFGLVYAWVFFLALVLTIVSAVLLILDIEYEAALNSTPFGDNVIDELEEEYVMKIGGHKWIS